MQDDWKYEEWKYEELKRVRPVDIISYLSELNQIEFAENYLYLLGELQYKNGCLDTLRAAKAEGHHPTNTN